MYKVFNKLADATCMQPDRVVANAICMQPGRGDRSSLKYMPQLISPLIQTQGDLSWVYAAWIAYIT